MKSSPGTTASDLQQGASSPAPGAGAPANQMRASSTRRDDAGAKDGDATNVDQLVPALYTELRRAARRHLRRSRRIAAGSDVTLNTTALVNEAYLKLRDGASVVWCSRAHFMAVAALAMRQIVIDRARTHLRQKRGGQFFDLALDDDAPARNMTPERLLEINDVLDRLSLLEPRLGQVVEYRFFGGMSDSEIAETLALTRRTVQRDWLKARALLRDALRD